MISEENLETIDSTTALAESGDDVLDGDGLSLGVFSVGGGITNDAVDEAAEDITDLTVDGASDALDTTTAGEAADGSLRDGGGVGLEDLLDALASTSRLTLGHFDGLDCVVLLEKKKRTTYYDSPTPVSAANFVFFLRLTFC